MPAAVGDISIIYLLRQKAATYATYTEKLQIQIKTHKIHIKADKTTDKTR